MKPLYIKKNGQVEKVTGAFAMPATYPAERVAYDNTNSGLNADDVQGAIDEIVGDVNDKVDKETGKGLSTNDYTTNEKNKLAGIAAGATKTASSTTNGNIKINDVETQVYDDSDIQDKINDSLTSVSGNPISISGLKSNQLAINPIITLEPIQAGSGTPSPSNIRTISGYDKVEALSGGVNVWDETWELGGIVWNTGQEIAATDRIRTGFIPAISEGTYYLYVLSSIIGSGYGVVFYNKSKERISANSGIAANSTFTTPANTAYIRLVYIGITSYTSGISVNYPSTVHDYVPYVKTTSISESLGQTVYWGRLNVRAGEFEVIGKLISVLWSASQGTPFTNNTRCLIGTISDAKGGYTNGDISNVAPNASGYNSDTVHFYIHPDNKALVVFLPNGTPDTDVQVCYELADSAKFTIQLTPREISLLKDYAYVSTNGTSIALDYHNGELASLADVSQLGETVNELGEYVGANKRGTPIDISSYTGTNKFVIPNDGYINVNSNGGTSGYVRVVVQDSDGNNIAFCYMNVTATYQIQSVFVKKGMLAYMQANTVSAATIGYIPLV